MTTPTRRSRPRRRRTDPAPRGPRTADPSPSMSTPSASERVEQRGDRAGAGLLVAVEGHRLGGQCGDRWHEAQDRPGKAAVDASTGLGGERAADGQLGLVGGRRLDVDTEGLPAPRSSGRCRGCEVRR